jgi:nitronate monooxygenase
MWNSTALTKLLGIAYPIIQGPFGGGLSSTKLASIVSNAGGMGSFGAESATPQQILEIAAEMRALTSKPFAINLWIPPQVPPAIDDAAFARNLERLAPYYQELGLAKPERPPQFGKDYHEQVRALLEARPPVFSFVYGVPEPSILQECRKRGIITAATVTTADEAEFVAQAGVDCIVASGFEAGGHKISFLKPPEESLIGSFALIPQVVDRVRIPVIAAGGIADSRGVAAALALGAQGVQIGTAFLACEESGASPIHRDMLFSDARRDTVLTKAFTGRLARGIRNRFAEDMRAAENELPPYPIQSWFAASLKAAAIAQRRPDLMSLWAGQAADLVQFNSAQALMNQLIRDLSA